MLGSGSGGGGGAVPTGIALSEFANCELLQRVLGALAPEEELEGHDVLLLDVPTAQLLKLADADQQCEAIIDGPQCAQMRKRMASARLLLALINDNEDADDADGGSHWSLVAMRRDAWADGTFVLEHYDPSGDPELNCDAAEQFASSLAERLSEICDTPADRIEVWRMPVTPQHDGAVCGLTAVCHLKALYDDFVDPATRSTPAASTKRGPRTPPTVARISWREVEAVRQAAAKAWAPEQLEAAEAHAAELALRTRRARQCTSECHVVFDLYAEEEGDDDNFGELEADDPSARFLSVGSATVKAQAALDGALYDFLQAVGLASLSGPLGSCGLTLEKCATSCTNDRTRFLSELREAGVSRQPDRQSFANAIGKATREGWLRPPYRGPFTTAGRQLRDAREAQPNAVAPQRQLSTMLPNLNGRY